MKSNIFFSLVLGCVFFALFAFGAIGMGGEFVKQVSSKHWEYVATSGFATIFFVIASSVIAFVTVKNIVMSSKK